MRAIVVTGAASGIGAATLARLRADGHKVIGVDLHGTDISADLSSADGRSAMYDGVVMAAPDGIRAILAGAGVSPPTEAATIVSVNYFGAVATLERLRPLLEGAEHPRAVLIASSAILNTVQSETIAACLGGDEAVAREIAQQHPENAYASSKHALAQWMRAEAASWARSGTLLNGVAPGVIRTAMTMPLLETPEGRERLAHAVPCAIERAGEAEEVAELIAFLVTMRSGLMVGQMLFADGGADVILRPNISWPGQIARSGTVSSTGRS